MSKIDFLIQECNRQSESCLYTSTALFIWLRILRCLKIVFIVVPLVLGSLASGKLLIAGGGQGIQVFSSVCAFLAGLLPTVYAALKFDDRLKECAQLASEFKNLQDRFRQAATIASQKAQPDFETLFEKLMTRLESARKSSFTTPEWCFKKAQKKIKSGDYDFDVDLKARQDVDQDAV